MVNRSGLVWLCAAALLASCAPRKPYELSKDDAARFGGRVLRVSPARADPWIFGLNDCIVYKAQTANEQIVGWKVVLASDWGESSYPKWATVCTAQSIRYNGKYVIVDLCAQAFGADGGCGGGGGTYRSRSGDAQGWQVRSDTGWVPLPK